MSEIFQWVRDIFIIIISLTFFQILLPDSTMAKYVKFILSIIILIIIFQPVITFLDLS